MKLNTFQQYNCLLGCYVFIALILRICQGGGGVKVALKRSPDRRYGIEWAYESFHSLLEKPAASFTECLMLC